MKKNNYKILLIGGSGQVGTEVRFFLDKKDFEILSPSSKDFNLSYAEDLFKQITSSDIDVVVNLAGFTKVDEAEKYYDLVHEINCLSAQYIAQATSKLNVPLIHFSTDYIFDGKKDGLYNETDEAKPINIYGKSKLCSERIIKVHNDKVIIIRTSGVYGLYGKNFFKTVKSLLEKNQEIKVISNQFTCPTWSYDIAVMLEKVLKKVLKSDFSNWGVYNFCSKDCISWYEFSEKIQKIFSLDGSLFPISYSNYESPASRPLNSCLECKKILNVFGVKTQSLDSSLKQLKAINSKT